VHEIVEANTVLEKEIDTSHDAENTKGEDPDTNDSDNGGFTTNKPTKEGEERCEKIDDQDSTSQLPWRDWRPERTVGTSDEDQPILSKRDFQEDDLIENTEVLNDTTILATSDHGCESDPGTKSKNDAEEDGHTP